MTAPSHNSDTFTIMVDGTPCKAHPGETVVEVAERNGVSIPTLCHDPRLAPAGACRMCLVEVHGQRRLQPGCAWRVTPNMAITTKSERITRHQQLLLALYLADHNLDEAGLPQETIAGNQLRQLARELSPPTLQAIAAPRPGRAHDINPYIRFDEEQCILCARCTRYCDEVEAVNAITLSGRGSRTTIGTAGMRGLLDTSCELCGGCIDTCPTGALSEKKVPLTVLDQPVERVRTTCNYCGVGCQMDIVVSQNRVIKISSPAAGTTVNDGNLCVKGRFAYDFIHHQDRLTQPLVRGDDGQLHPSSWQHAIEVVARGLNKVRDNHGADALGFVSSSRCTGEENYLLQKLSRAAFGTNNCHQCAAT